MRNNPSCILVLLLASILTIPWLSSKNFYTRGEAREAIVAQSMLRSSDWVIGSGYGDIVPSKPPLLHWGMALSATFLGEHNELSARLPSALAFISFLVMWCAFLEKRYGSETALLSSLILMSSAEWYRSGVSARVDTLLTFFLCASFLLLFRWCESGQKRFALLAVVSISLGVLTKGPVALVLPAAVLFCFLLASKKGLKHAFFSVIFISLPALLLASLWYLAAYLARGEEFFARFFYENIARFSSTQEDEPHKHSFIYLPLSLLLGFLPWTLFFTPFIPEYLKGLKDLSLSRLLKLKGFELFILLTVLIVIGFYSIPSGKRSVYILPVYPFISLWMAQALLALKTKRALKFRSAASLILTLLFLPYAIFLCLALFPDMQALLLKFNHGAQMQVFKQALSSFAAEPINLIVLLIYPLIMLSAFYLRLPAKIQHFPIRLGLALFMIGLILNAQILPAFSNALSPKTFAARVSSIAGNSSQLYSFGYEFYGMSFYLERTIYPLNDKAKAGDLLFCYERDLDKLKEKLPPQLKTVWLDRSDYFIEKPGARLLLLKLETA